MERGEEECLAEVAMAEAAAMEAASVVADTALGVEVSEVST